MKFEDILGLYNYWIVIFLMMTGFYIVLARRNLIKAVIGLNIFQTSVFLLYVTMGKVKGGTAPVIPPHVAKAAAHASHHGADHHGAGHNDTGAVHHGAGDHDVGHTGEALTDHAAETLAHSGGEAAEPSLGHGLADTAEHVSEHAETLEHAAETIIYSNPLPSVLMLTAIVVGIATTALALALVVRIREDYGTIDEDAILELDREEGTGHALASVDPMEATEGATA